MPKFGDNKNEIDEFLKNWKKDNTNDSNNKTFISDKFEYENSLYKLLYGKIKSNFAEEKRIIINEYFADIFDAKNIKWKILNNLNVFDEEITKLFEKYLNKCNFSEKIWITKYLSGINGRYALIMFKNENGTIDNNGFSITEPNLIPAAINYKNTRNDEIIEVSINYENHLMYGNSTYCLNEIYSIFNNQVSITRNLWDVKKEKLIKRPKKVLSFDTYNNLKFEKVDIIKQKFLPLEILSFNIYDRTRTHKIESKLAMLEKYDEILAILPFWEKGGIIANVDDVTSNTQSKQDCNFMNFLLLKGFLRTKSRSTQFPTTLKEEVVTWQPTSIMQSVRKTRDELWNEIKEDQGMPSVDKINSAQKSIPEIRAKQFLSSPKIEREKRIYINFLNKLGKKFLMFLKECNLEEFKIIESNDFKDWNVTAEIDLITKENIFETIKIMGKSNDEIR